MRVLVLCGDRWHPAAVPRQGLGALEAGDFAFDYLDDAGGWSPELLAAHPLIVLTKSNNVSAVNWTGWMSADAQSALAGYVRAGNGLLAVHSGIAGYEQCPLIRSVLGGAFVRHPEQCPVTVEPGAGHPLTAGSGAFTLQDEHYFVAQDDPAADVFVTTRSVHGEQPGGWRRAEGAGRAAVLTPGHNLEVWLHPSFQALLRNALRWCAGAS